MEHSGDTKEANVLLNNLDEANTRRYQAIIDACEQHDVNKLIECANVGGFIDDGLRRRAWPLLLNCSEDSVRSPPSIETWKSLPRHRDEDQVQLDVDRAFVYYPNSESKENISSNKTKLYNLIAQVLRIHPMLCYFQGYHDIAQVLLLVLGEEHAYPAVVKLSLCRIRDYMLPSLAPAIQHLRLIPGILLMANAPLAKRLSQIEPFFALSAALTLYAHDIQEYSDIARLYDFFFAHEPVMTIYLFASIILQRSSELLSIPVDEPEMLHFTLSKLPQPLDLESLIQDSLSLFERFPPEKLPHRLWQRISSNSVLKTDRDINVRHDVKQAEKLFQAQEKELWRQQAVKKSLAYLVRHKKPIASVGSALLVGVLAIWLQKSGHDRTLLIGLGRIISPIKGKW